MLIALGLRWDNDAANGAILMTRWIAALAAMLLAAFTLLPAIAQRATDMRLEDAGFTMRAADTPQKMARLRQLPPHKFVTRSKSGGQYYVYADPELCGCAFVGDAKAMQAYRDMMAAKSPGQVASTPDGRSLESVMAGRMEADFTDIEPNDILEFRF